MERHTQEVKSVYRELKSRRLLDSSKSNSRRRNVGLERKRTFEKEEYKLSPTANSRARTNLESAKIIEVNPDEILRVSRKREGAVTDLPAHLKPAQREYANSMQTRMTRFASDEGRLQSQSVGGEWPSTAQNYGEDAESFDEDEEDDEEDDDEDDDEEVDYLEEDMPDMEALGTGGGLGKSSFGHRKTQTRTSQLDELKQRTSTSPGHRYVQSTLGVNLIQQKERKAAREQSKKNREMLIKLESSIDQREKQLDKMESDARDLTKRIESTVETLNMQCKLAERDKLERCKALLKNIEELSEKLAPIQADLSKGLLPNVIDEGIDAMMFSLDTQRQKTEKEFGEMLEEHKKHVSNFETSISLLPDWLKSLIRKISTASSSSKPTVPGTPSSWGNGEMRRRKSSTFSQFDTEPSGLFSSMLGLIRKILCIRLTFGGILWIFIVLLKATLGFALLAFLFAMYFT